MQFADALVGIPCSNRFGSAELTSVSIDSRTCRPGSVFVCMPGNRHDSHDFIPKAIESGASAIIVTDNAAFERATSMQVACAIVEDAADTCWRLCKNVYGDPTAKLKMIGVTGTNGKTTTAWIIKGILENLGVCAAYMGTLGAQSKVDSFELSHTTPFCPEASEAIVRLANAGATHVAMEVSSHALAQRRVHGFEFDAAVFTNLTQDHLDFHRDAEEYFEAKALLFSGIGQSKSPIPVINADDPFGQRLLSKHEGAIDFGERGRVLRWTWSVFTPHSFSVDFVFQGENYRATAGLGARFNVQNSLSALAAVAAIGVPMSDAVAALAKVTPVPGRFESVPTHADYSVIVDYAHTPDALEKLLQSVREMNPTGVLTVFGCGGDRDRTKRPKMAAAAAKYSTRLYVTSDNPRTEDPSAIISEILPGVGEVSYVVEPDRRAAIALAIHDAKEGEVVVIAGKGHEDYQIVGTTKSPFDDRVEAERAITERLE